MAPQNQISQLSGPYTLLARDPQGQPVEIVLPAGVATLANPAGLQVAQQAVTSVRNVVQRLVQHAVIRNGEPSCRATFFNDPVNCLKWDIDGKLYSATGLALDLTMMATGKRPKSIAGPQFWDEAFDIVEHFRDMPRSVLTICRDSAPSANSPTASSSTDTPIPTTIRSYSPIPLDSQVEGHASTVTARTTTQMEAYEAKRIAPQLRRVAAAQVREEPVVHSVRRCQILP